jgi:hypothetical protein
MAEKLSILIALEGGDEIAKQLADIGEAGQKAFADIGKSAEQAGGFKNIKPEEVTQKLKDMGVTGVDAINKIQKAVQSAGRLETLVEGITAVETGFVALGRAAGPVIGTLIAAAGAIAKAWLGIAKSINEVDAAAAKLGVSFQQFDKLRQGFLQAGISSEAVTSGLQKLKSQLDQMDVERVKQAFNELADAATRGFGAQGTAQLRLLQQAAEGVGPAADAAREALVKLGQASGGEQLGKTAEAFQRLGIQGRTLNEVMPQIIAKLQAMPDSVERTNLAISLLGDKLGVELIAALRTGSLTIEQFNAATGNLTREQQIAAAQTQQSLNQMSTAWDNFKANVIAPIAIPLFDFMKRELDEISKRIATTKQEWDALKGALSTITPKTTIDISLTQSLAPEIDKVNQKLAETEQKAAATNQALQQTGQAGQQAGQQAAQGLQLITDPFTGLPQYVRAANEALAQTGQAGQQAGQQASQGLQQVDTAAQTTNSTLSTLASTLAGWNWDPIAAGVRVWNDITAAVQRFIDKVLVAIGLKPAGGSAPAAADGGGGMAGGGLLGGRGSGTSDSNLAWVSRGEHIMPARAVAQPGVLAFLEALRRSGGNLSRVLDGMGRFELGGLVRSPMPAFAAGGLAGGMSNVTIQFPGLPAIGGLRASSDVVDQLHRAAALAQVRSGGRKPSRYS